MSRLDNIILNCINKTLDGKQEKLGDYIDPIKADIKALMLKIIGDNEPVSNKLHGANKPNYKFITNRNKLRGKLREQVDEL